ncbi:MAG: flagellar FlbD family protein [Actinomycetota bacterium]|jgi:flagellar protein FlbD|nr:flagellar FlbD family protein [Actinomycetota bacterium]MDA8278574.1 flagellar FlbD family protein [Actinomycetota bacterium]
MIGVTRLNGEEMVINADLIQRVEANPDTILVLSDGTHYIVREPVDEVVEKVKRFQAEILAEAAYLGRKGDPPPSLRLVMDSEE